MVKTISLHINTKIDKEKTSSQLYVPKMIDYGSIHISKILKKKILYTNITTIILF